LGLGSWCGNLGSLFFGHQISIFAHFGGVGLGTWCFGLVEGIWAAFFFVIIFRFLHISGFRALKDSSVIFVAEEYAAIQYPKELRRTIPTGHVYIIMRGLLSTKKSPIASQHLAGQGNEIFCRLPFCDGSRSAGHLQPQINRYAARRWKKSERITAENPA
jgi:hypothetical protein